MYRACYPAWTVVPRGTCEEVIHGVTTLRANAQLTKIACKGIVDADDYSDPEISFLESKGIAILPVSEIENSFLLPDVVAAIATIEGHEGKNRDQLCADVMANLFEHAKNPRNRLASVMRYGRRRIDRTLKKIDLSDAANPSQLADVYSTSTSALDVASIIQAAEDAIDTAIRDEDARKLLKWYDNKALMSIACRAKGCGREQFEQWVMRTLRSGHPPELLVALSRYLPVIELPK